MEEALEEAGKWKEDGALRPRPSEKALGDGGSGHTTAVLPSCSTPKACSRPALEISRTTCLESPYSLLMLRTVLNDSKCLS